MSADIVSPLECVVSVLQFVRADAVLLPCSRACAVSSGLTVFVVAAVLAVVNVSAAVCFACVCDRYAPQ